MQHSKVPTKLAGDQKFGRSSRCANFLFNNQKIEQRITDNITYEEQKIPFLVYILYANIDSTLFYNGVQV